MLKDDKKKGPCLSVFFEAETEGLTAGGKFILPRRTPDSAYIDFYILLSCLFYFLETPAKICRKQPKKEGAGLSASGNCENKTTILSPRSLLKKHCSTPALYARVLPERAADFPTSSVSGS